MKKMMCTGNVEVQGRTVFVEGRVYDFKPVVVNGVSSYEVEGEGGMGVFSKKEPVMKKNFKKLSKKQLKNL